MRVYQIHYTLSHGDSVTCVQSVKNTQYTGIEQNQNNFHRLMNKLNRIDGVGRGGGGGGGGVKSFWQLRSRRNKNLEAGRNPS